MISIAADSELLISPNISIRDALKRLDKTGEGILFVTDATGRLIGALTDGDIRRGILHGCQLTDQITSIYNEHPFVFYEDAYSEESCRKSMRENRYEVVPILSVEKFVVAYEKWNNLFGAEETPIARESCGPEVV